MKNRKWIVQLRFENYRDAIKFSANLFNRGKSALVFQEAAGPRKTKRIGEVK